MCVVDGLADTAIDPWTDDDGGATPPSGATSSGSGAGPGRGPDVVSLRPRTDREGAGRSAPTPTPLGGHVRPYPGSPMGPRGTAKYGLPALRIGEASHPGPPDVGDGDMDRVRHAAAVAARVARIDELVAGMRAEYRILQAERFGLVGAHTPGDPARVPPPGPPRSARRSGTPSSAFSSSDGAPPTSDGGGTNHRTSHTTTSSFFARIRGEAGAGTGEGHDTPPPAYGSGDEGPWSLSPGSPGEGTLDDQSSHDPAAGSSHKVPCRWLGPDTPGGRICGCRPGVPFTPPMSSASAAAARGRCPIRTPPSPCGPSSPPAGWEGDRCGPSTPFGGRDGTLFHSLHRVGRDGCYCEVFCLCAVKARTDGRLSLAGPGDATGADSETTPDKRRPRAPTVAPRPPRRLPCVGRETYGAVLAPYDCLEPGNLYEALHSMRRVCSCNRVWVKYYHEDMGWGPFLSTVPVSAVARGAMGGTCLSGRQASSTTWTRSMSPASAPWTPFGPMGYPDDPAIVDNPYQVGLFLGAPRPRGNQQRTLFPPTAPGVPAVVFGVPARPRVSPITLRFPRGFVTGSKLLPARLPMPALGRGGGPTGRR